MDVIEQFLNKISYKFEKGYPDLDNPKDKALLESILEGMKINLNEVLLEEVSNREITSNTRQAIDYIIKNTSKGFKTQTDPKRLGNPEKHSSDDFKVIIKDLFKTDDINIYGPKSGPNPSGKFDMYEFDTDEFGLVQIILSGGGNAGEQYEKEFVNVSQELAGEPTESLPKNLQTLYKELGIDNTKLTSKDIEFAGTADTKRSLSLEGPKDIGKTISDMTIKYNGKDYYLSLKNKAGSGIYSGKNIPFIYEQDGKVIYDSSKRNSIPGIGLLFDIFNIDEARLAQGINDYINQEGKADDWSSISIDEDKFKKLLASSLGYGYYYVRETKGNDVKVIPLLTPKDALNAIGKITKTEIKYPGPNTKQLTMKIDTDSPLFGVSQYQVSVRNTAGKVLPLSLRISKTK